MSSYNIANLISKVSEEVATQIAKKCRCQQPHSHLRPRQEELPRVSAHTLYFQKLESLAYIFVAGCVGLSQRPLKFKFKMSIVYLHSILCSGLQNTHLFRVRVRFGRSRSFRVIQGR